jgi:S-adenosylmethionine synthetase
MSFEKVNPSHPDKVADRIAGAIVDLAYKKQENPKIAVEVLIGHGNCYIVTEASVHMTNAEIREIIDKITTGIDDFDYIEVPQDAELAKNQAEEIRCGDNGIFKGVYIKREERVLTDTVQALYKQFPTDGKFIYDATTKKFIACQSNATSDEIMQAIIKTELPANTSITINPLGPWTGGTSVDTGATNRKLGSDMGRAVTGGGLHGKDLSKADVSINIACHLMAQQYQSTVEAQCAIGDTAVEFVLHGAGRETRTVEKTYAEVVEMARDYINEIGGFEKLAEWGLV